MTALKLGFSFSAMHCIIQILYYYMQEMCGTYRRSLVMLFWATDMQFWMESTRSTTQENQ